MSKLIYDYTSGYPVLASIICKLMDENNAVSKPKSWTPEGFLLIEKKIYDKKVSLFGSLINKMENSRELRNFVYSALFKGYLDLYNIYDSVIDAAALYGFIRKQDDGVLSDKKVVVKTVQYQDKTIIEAVV